MSCIKLAIDIGNTHSDVGVVDCEALLCLTHIDINTFELESRLGWAIDECLAAAAIRPYSVVVSSVVGSVKTIVENIIGKYEFPQFSWVRYHSGLPITLAYENPLSLGADRIADCLYAHSKNPSADQIIIDAGTTITVDFLQHGCYFAGGVILPGILMQLNSLNRGTAELPRLALKDLSRDFPGTSTHSCISAGVRYSVAGALNELVRKYKKHFGSHCLVLSTGGTWQYTQDLIEFDYNYNKDMTLIGTALFFERAEKF